MARDVATALLADPSQARLGGVVAEVTVLFADLRGFTPFSEQAPPERVVAMLNEHFGRAVQEPGWPLFRVGVNTGPATYQAIAQVAVAHPLEEIEIRGKRQRIAPWVLDGLHPGGAPDGDGRPR